VTRTRAEMQSGDEDRRTSRARDKMSFTNKAGNVKKNKKKHTHRKVNDTKPCFFVANRCKFPETIEKTASCCLRSKNVVFES